MRDINYEIEVAYNQALSSLPIPVFNTTLPDEENPENYIIFQVLNNTDQSTKNSDDTDITVQISIYTTADSNNPNSVNSITNQVIDTMLNHKHISPIMLDTRLTSDVSNTISFSANIRFEERILQFTHSVQHNLI